MSAGIPGITEVDLGPDLNERLERAAERMGKSIPETIRDALEEHCDRVLQSEASEPTEAPGPTDLSDLALPPALAQYIGAIDTGGAYDASRAKEDFGRILEEKRRTGHL